MIGYFRNFEAIRAWAHRRAEEANEDYQRTGNLVSLGYALALQDVARSEMGDGVEVPAYQRDLEVHSANVIELREWMRDVA